MWRRAWASRGLRRGRGSGRRPWWRSDFSGSHAVFHLVGFAQGHGGGAAAMLGVIAQALIAALAILWPERKSPATGEA
jgi:hypothetical protein